MSCFSVYHFKCKWAAYSRPVFRRGHSIYISALHTYSNKQPVEATWLRAREPMFSHACMNRSQTQMKEKLWLKKHLKNEPGRLGMVIWYIYVLVEFPQLICNDRWWATHIHTNTLITSAMRFNETTRTQTETMVMLDCPSAAVGWAWAVWLWDWFGLMGIKK